MNAPLYALLILCGIGIIISVIMIIKILLDRYIFRKPIPKRIFIIHPVRNISNEWRSGLYKFVEKLERRGNIVYFPIRDTNQEDETGYRICLQNMLALKNADIAYVAWDGKSQGVLFDLGMAFAFRKPIKIIDGYFPPPTEGKSFQSMIHMWESLYN